MAPLNVKWVLYYIIYFYNLYDIIYDISQIYEVTFLAIMTQMIITLDRSKTENGVTREYSAKKSGRVCNYQSSMLRGEIYFDPLSYVWEGHINPLSKSAKILRFKTGLKQFLRTLEGKYEGYFCIWWVFGLKISKWIKLTCSTKQSGSKYLSGP